MIDDKGIPLGAPDSGIIRDVVLKYLKKTSVHYVRLKRITDHEKFADYCRRYPGIMPLFTFGVDSMLYEWVERKGSGEREGGAR